MSKDRGERNDRERKRNFGIGVAEMSKKKKNDKYFGNCITEILLAHLNLTVAH